MKAKRPQDSKEDKNAEYANPSQRSKSRRDRPNSLDARRSSARPNLSRKPIWRIQKCFNTVRNMLGWPQESTAESRFPLWAAAWVCLLSESIPMSCFIFTAWRISSALEPPAASCDQVQLRDLDRRHRSVHRFHYAAQYQLPGAFCPYRQLCAAGKARFAAGRKGSDWVGNVLYPICFTATMRVLTEMEEDGVLAGGDGSRRPLYERRGGNALCLLTVSDCPLRGESLPAQGGRPAHPG